MPFIPLDDLGSEYYQASRMDKMNPDFVSAFEPMAEEFYQLTGRPLRITDTYRTYDEQAELKKRKPFLAASPGKSMHEKGMAMDIHQEDVPYVTPLLEKYGFHRPVLSKGETWHIELKPDTSAMMAGPGATKGSSFIPLEKLDELDKIAPPKSGFIPLEELDKQQPSILQNIKKNILQPEQTEFDTYAEPSKVAGEAIKTGIEKTQEAMFWPLTKALSLAHRNIIEPVRQRDITSTSLIPTPGMGAPEAFAPLAEEKTFVPTMEFALAPLYFGLVNRSLQVLGKYGKQGFYKYAPDWMFRKGEAGLPEVLPPERISQILGGMSGEERAAMARKYPEFKDVLTDWQMGGKVPETVIPPEASGIGAIARPAAAGELVEPQAKLPAGQGFEMRPQTIRRPVEPYTSEHPYYYPPEEIAPPGGREIPERSLGVTPIQEPIVPVSENIVPEQKILGDVSLLPENISQAREEMGVLSDYDKSNFIEWLGRAKNIYHKLSKGESVPIYRTTVNENEIMPGKYVTLSESYAKDHINNLPAWERKNAKIIKGTAKADELIPVNPNEFYYAPSPPAEPVQAKEPWEMSKKEWFHPQINRSFIDKMESSKDGTIIGKVGDFVHGEKSRALLNSVLNVSIMKITKPINKGNITQLPDNIEFKGATGTYNKQRIIFINPTHDMVKTLWEESAHEVRRLKGREMTRVDFEKMSMPEYQNLPEEISGKKFAEYLGRLANKEFTHEDIVKKALSEGKPVPPEVLADYPDLVKKYYSGASPEALIKYLGEKIPDLGSDLKYQAKVTLGSKLGAMARRREASEAQLKPASKMFDRAGVFNPNIPLTENLGMKFASNHSMGRPQETEAMQNASDLITKQFDQRLDLLSEAKAPLENVRDNYFPGMWTNPSRKAFNQAVGEWIEQNGPPPNGDIFLLGENEVKQIHDRVKELIKTGKGVEDNTALSFMSKRPFKGRESFRKEKVFDDIMDAVKFGLEPISNNPIDLVNLKLREMDRAIMAYQAINAYREQGKVKFIPATSQVPEGMTKIDDPFGTVFGPPDPKVYGKTIKGYYVADKAVADVLNNFLSKTLYQSLGRPFKYYMGLGNSLNQFQLGMGSFFHGGFTSIETQITAGAEVLKDIYGVAVGNRSMSNLWDTLKRYPTAILSTPKTGRNLINEWLNQSVDIKDNIPLKDLFAQHSGNPYPILAKAAELAGAGFKQEKGLQTEQLVKMSREWFGERKFKAALRSPIGLSEILAKPLMEMWVPAQKAGVFAEMAGRIMEMNPDKTLSELSSDFRQAWNRTDARLGQVHYNRLFIHNYAKNLAQALVRAPGWTGGTIAEVGGAPKDAIKFIADWQKTGKAPKNLPDRVAYLLSLLGTTAMINGLLTYALTGEQPHGMDWWAFRDGGKDVKGRPTRFLIPSYVKDLLAYYKRPVHTILAKTHPLISMINDVYKGNDYFGNQFRDPEDGWLSQGFDTGKYILKQYKPFWVRNIEQSKRGTGGLSDAAKIAISNIGIAPAPAKLSNSPDMDVIDAYTERFGSRLKSKAEAEKQEIKRGLKETFDKEGLETYRQKLIESVNKGEITRKDMQKMIKDTRLQADIRQFKSVPLEVQIRAYNVAPPERQEILKKYVIQKYGKAQPEEKRRLNEQFRKIINP